MKDDVSTVSESRGLSRYYLITGVVEGVLALVSLLLIPGDPKNAWLMGLSMTRFALAGLLSGLICLFTAAAFLYYRQAGFRSRVNAGSDRAAGLFGALFPGLLAVLGVLVLGPYLVLLTRRPVEEIFIRLSPFTLYAASRLIQLVLVSSLDMIRRKKSGAIIRDPKLTLKATLAVFAGILAAAYLSISLIKVTTQHREVWRLGRYLDLTYENNLPAFFSAFLLGLAGYFLLLIYRRKRSQDGAFLKHWLSLSLIFAFLVLDEIFELHEQLGLITKYLLGPDNLLFVDWAYVGIPLVLVFGLIFYKFYRHLPPREKRGFALAAGLYVGGALGVEIIGSAAFMNFSLNPGLAFVLFAVVEEITEMVGMIYFIHVLMRYRETLVGEG